MKTCIVFNTIKWALAGNDFEKEFAISLICSPLVEPFFGSTLESVRDRVVIYSHSENERTKRLNVILN